MATAGKPTWQKKPRPKRVTLLKPGTTQNSLGEVTAAFTSVATVWASVEPLSGREIWMATQVQADVTHKITMRYRSDVDPTWRVQLNGRTFNLVSVLNLEERNRTLECMAMEQVPA